MRILLIGCGAVGLSLASALYEAGIDLELIARGKTAEAVRGKGIKRQGALGEAFIEPEKVRVTESAAETQGAYDYIIISSKATGNADIAASLALRNDKILAEGGSLVLCQNGYGTEEAFLAVFDKKRIFHASFSIGFLRPEPSVSEVSVMVSPVTIGSLFGAPEEAAKPLAQALEKGGIPAKTTEEIGKTLWAKLLYNCTLNPLSAILKTNYGGLMKSEGSVSIMNGIIDEMFKVMHAAGYETFWKDADEYRRAFYEKILPPTYTHRSSTLQDMENRLPTEIDSLNGAVVKLGESLGIDTPCNRIITNIVKSMESLYDKG